MRWILLLIIILFLSGCVSEEYKCEDDSECMPIITECGLCNDYNDAINKKFYFEINSEYETRCGDDIHDCDKPLSGKGLCIKGKCTLSD